MALHQKVLLVDASTGFYKLVRYPLDDFFGPVDLGLHLSRLGALPYRGRGGLLIRSIEAAGLTGRGGAGFPTARKLAAVGSGQGRKVVVANAAEAEELDALDARVAKVVAAVRERRYGIDPAKAS